MQNREIGSYVLESLLGQGGMGEVYLARHKSLGTRAAVKVMTPAGAQEEEFRERFNREARTQAKLSHPNIARVLDHVEKDGRWYLIIEFMERGTVKDRMVAQEGQPFPVEKAVGWARQSLEGLGHAHDQGIIHRDIKPANILLNDRDEAALTDFGLAKMLGDVDGKLTSTGMSMGTPEYMSPEQILASAELDHRTDLYAMGVVLYELLAGRPPFPMGSISELQRVLVVDPPPLCELNPAVPAELEVIVMRALAKEPDERWATAEEFAGALAAWQGQPSATAGVPVAVLPPSPPTAPQSTPSDGRVAESASTELLESTPTVQVAGSSPRAAAPPPGPAVPPPPAADGSNQGVAALPPLVPHDPSLSSSYSSPRAGNIIAVGLIVAFLGVAALGGWWFFGRGGGEEGGEMVAQEATTAPPPVEDPLASNDGEVDDESGEAAVESGSEAPEEGFPDATTDSPADPVPVEAGSEGAATGGAAPAGVPPREQIAAASPEVAPSSGVVKPAASTASAVAALPREPRVGVLALGPESFTLPFGAELEDRLRALGIDAENARASVRINDLVRRYGNDLDTTEVVAAAYAEGFNVLVFARVDPLSRRSITVLGSSSTATTSSVTVDAFLVLEERAMHPAWTDRVEFTALSAPAKAEACLRGANVEMADAITDGWQQFRRRHVR